MPLPRFLKPTSVADLVRLGSAHDGGYILPKSLLAQTDLLLSLGLGDNWSFEKDFLAKSQADLVCCDHTVHAKFWVRRFGWDCLKLVCGRFSSFRRLFTYASYRRFFFQKRATHLVSKIGYARQGDLDLLTLFEKYDQRCVFLKIDIEGAEYRILEQILSLRERIVGIVMEWHDVDLHKERIEKFVKCLEENFVLVHLHPNNSGGLDHEGNPLVLEMSFARRDLVSKAPHSVKLDAPNAPHLPEIEVTYA